jgi:hypothetical protein
MVIVEKYCSVALSLYCNLYAMQSKCFCISGASVGACTWLKVRARAARCVRDMAGLCELSPLYQSLVLCTRSYKIVIVQVEEREGASGVM